MVTDGSPVESFLPSCRKTDVVLYTCSRVNDNAVVDLMRTYCSCNKSCIISMSGIPISAVKHSDRIIPLRGQTIEESNEAALIVKL